MIILVEDEPIYQKLISSALKDLNCEIDIASDGFTAIEKFNPSKHKLAIIDLVLPGPMNGIEVIKKFRQKNPELKILVCSGYGNQTIQTKIKKAGAKDFIFKPFTPDQMMEKVTMLLDAEIMPEKQTFVQTENDLSEQHDPKIKKSDTDTDDQPIPHNNEWVTPEIFKNFPQSVIDEIIEIGSVIEIQKQCRDIVNFTKSIICILSGSVRCYCRNQVFGILKTGKSLGYESLTKTLNPECTIEIEALSQVSILIIPKIEFLQFFLNHSDLLLSQLETNLKQAMPNNLLYLSGYLNNPPNTGDKNHLQPRFDIIDHS